LTTFFLVRHATVEAVGNSIVGWTPGIHLSPEGNLQARRLAEGLGNQAIAAIYSSPLERASETAEYISTRIDLPVRACQSLGEVRYGEWTGGRLDDLATDRKWQLFNSFRSLTRVPGGELLLEVQTRVIAELELLRERHPDQTIVLVSHSDVIRAAVGYVVGVPIDLLHRIEISPASITIIRVEEGDAQVLCVNMKYDR
jgi:broad specificity phosphatase PhoE